MLFEPLLGQFAEGGSLTAMTRALLENALQAGPVDALFERVAQRQYTRELLFSTVVNSMTLVACRVYKTPRSVYDDHPEWFPVSLKCFYEKLNRVEPVVMRELVRDNAARCGDVVRALGGRSPDLLRGYRTKILDGNALAGTDRRIKELRGSTSAALPGKSLVVLDPALGLAIDVFPCEDGHAQERSLLPAVLETVAPKDLWIEDRNFCTLGFILGVADRKGFFLVREHKGLPWEAVTALQYQGRTDTGKVYQQRVRVTGEGGKALEFRRIVVELDEPTRDGETHLALLTNVPRVSAVKLARLYRRRWGIEGLFNVLTVTLRCENKGLGYPRAALFGFCAALLAYNALATVKAALISVHGAEKVEREVSIQKVAEKVCRSFEGMMDWTPAERWLGFQGMTAEGLAKFMRGQAEKVDLRKVKKAKTQPKKKAGPRRAQDPSKPHVSTARLLTARRKPK